MYKKAFLIMLVVFHLGAGLSWAATVQLTWNPNAEPDLAGYKLYYGTVPRTTAPYTQTVAINDKNTSTWNLTLSSGTYYLAVTALDAIGNESAFSSEVSAVVPSTEPPGKPGKPVLIP